MAPQLTPRNWRSIAILEAAVVVLLLWDSASVRRQLTRVSQTFVEEENPIAWALVYESPLWKFEEIVRTSKAWVNHLPVGNLPVEIKTKPVLASCASLAYTNHVRILLENGADAETAISWHKAYGSEEAVALIKEQAEVLKRDSVISPTRSDKGPQ